MLLLITLTLLEHDFIDTQDFCKLISIICLPAFVTLNLEIGIYRIGSLGNTMRSKSD